MPEPEKVINMIDVPPDPTDPLDASVEITVNDRTFTLRFADCTALDSRACRQEVGISITGIFNRMQTDPDLDDVAAIVWLARRKDGETKLTFEEVAAGIGYGAELKVTSNVVEDVKDPE